MGRPLGRRGIHVEDPKMVAAGLEESLNRTDILRAECRRDRAETGMLHDPIEAVVPRGREAEEISLLVAFVSCRRKGTSQCDRGR